MILTCTAISYKPNAHYFGRNLDLEKSYGECVTITPRNYRFNMRCMPPLEKHFAMIGAAAVVDGYPLYFEATNEKGLSMAGLNFPDNADYKPCCKSKCNVAPFELIPWLLGKCASVDDAVALLESVNVADVSFSENLPSTPLHWLLSDRVRSVAVECVKSGLNVQNNPYGVLTNNPTFDYHVLNVTNYMHLHEGAAENLLCPDSAMQNYSLGMGAMGLPGDFSSASRFVRAVFVKSKSKAQADEKSCVNQFFHILSSVAMPKGCVLTKDGEYEYTRYSSCCNTDKGVYYYTTYNNSAVTVVDMHSVDLDADEVFICNTLAE